MKQATDHRDTLYTIDKRGNRKWVYAHYLPGRFFRLRTLVGWLLVAIYISLPWVLVDGKQAVHLDIPHRRFIFFGVELWATDTLFLFLTLAILGFSLFFFTSLLGRIWCGWACPQTVFLEFVFRPIERLIEGSDSERRKLDNAPWTIRKIIKKVVKHFFCAVIAWIIASSALAYFLGREPLLEMMTHSPLENLGPFLMTAALMGLMAFQFGWFREQFCTLLCPYARFQSVLMDENSMIVGYDKLRGEPRGKLRAQSDQHGDCVDCGLCVRVCPTGIDIRNGTQLECIACTACVDACNSVMQKLGKPLGLIRYSTEAYLLRKPTHMFRPRILIYALILATLAALFIFQATHRQTFEVELVRARTDVAFEVDSQNMVTNQFSVRIGNKSQVPLHFNLEVIEPSGVQIASALSAIELKFEETKQVPAFIRAPLNMFHDGRLAVEVQITTSSGSPIRRKLVLIGPEQEGEDDN